LWLDWSIGIGFASDSSTGHASGEWTVISTTDDNCTITGIIDIKISSLWCDVTIQCWIIKRIDRYQLILWAKESRVLSIQSW
jgi:hypothetical protein